ncbi:MAG: hypothetical protein ACOX36_00670 [Saccharofermentanales bacterium]|jgi:hypothetical protein
MMKKYERMTTLRFMALGDHRDNAKNHHYRAHSKAGGDRGI